MSSNISKAQYLSKCCKLTGQAFNFICHLILSLASFKLCTTDERFKEERNLTYISKWLRKSIKQYDSFDKSLEGLQAFFANAEVLSAFFIFIFFYFSFSFPYAFKGLFLFRSSLATSREKCYRTSAYFQVPAFKTSLLQAQTYRMILLP